MRHLFGDQFEVFSAGTVARGVRPEVLTVLEELGIDAGGQSSKTIDQLDGLGAECVVTVCDDAREKCPNVLGLEQTFHRGFFDPSSQSGTKEERITAFRKSRDEIMTWLEATFR